MESNISGQPWLDPDGRIYSDDALREISKNWSAQMWERFLKETVECPQKEELITDLLLTDELDGIWLDEVPDNSDVSEKIRRLIRSHLTPRQQHVIRLTFWESKSERQIAKMLGVSRSTVVGLKKDSLNKLKRLIENRLTVSPIGKRQKQNLPKGEIQNDCSSEDSSCVSIRNASL